LSAAAVRPSVVPERHVHAADSDVRRRDDHLPGIRSTVRADDARLVRNLAGDWQPAVAPDDRRRHPALHTSGYDWPAGAARAWFQELGSGPGFHLLRRQLRAARL